MLRCGSLIFACILLSVACGGPSAAPPQENALAAVSGNLNITNKDCNMLQGLYDYPHNDIRILPVTCGDVISDHKETVKIGRTSYLGIPANNGSEDCSFHLIPTGNESFRGDVYSFSPGKTIINVECRKSGVGQRCSCFFVSNLD